MKIDVHVHILAPDFIKDIRKNLDRDAHFKLLHDNPKAKFATAEDVLENMEKTGIDKSVVFGFSCLDPGMAREANDYIIETVKRYPDRFIGFAIVPPKDAGMEKELIRCHEAGLKGVGEVIPSSVQIDISDQDQVGAFTAVCRELGLPILMHTNELVGHYYPGKGEMGPEQAYRFAINNPDNRITIPNRLQMSGELLWAPPDKSRREPAANATARVVQKHPRSHPIRQIVRMPARLYMVTCKP
jgi:predicted TIM-barrel fold metal-dependent hydrolase